MALLAEHSAQVEIRLSLVSGPLAVRDALAQIMVSSPVSGLEAGHRASVEIVLAEVLNNIAEHAYLGGPGEIRVVATGKPEGLFCEISDRGRVMPDETPPPGLLPGEAFPEGGFGWHLIRSLTCALAYQRLGDWNLLSFMIPA